MHRKKQRESKEKKRRVWMCLLLTYIERTRCSPSWQVIPVHVQWDSSDSCQLLRTFRVSLKALLISNNARPTRWKIQSKFKTWNLKNKRKDPPNQRPINPKGGSFQMLPSWVRARDEGQKNVVEITKKARATVPISVPIFLMDSMVSKFQLFSSPSLDLMWRRQWCLKQWRLK